MKFITSKTPQNQQLRVFASRYSSQEFSQMLLDFQL